MRFGAAGIVLSALAWGQQVQTVQVASGVGAVTDIQHAGDGSGRLFLVQQNGVIRVLANGALGPAPFLDIRNKTRADGERGLLGLAFSPRYAETRWFYVNYTDLNGDTVIARYTAAGQTADAASELVLLRIGQPYANHNGGQLRFGPDGYLYVGTGDGGSGGDPLGNGQNLATLLGKILRIDVESEPGRILVPAGNPFANTPGARGEIWAYGLRNPWRFSFDRATGDLWIADVGQNAYEEVNFQPASSGGGENYGWNRMEGMHCYRGGCSFDGLTLPVAEYRHGSGDCSVTGGFVYRGRLFPGLRGLYLYGDYCSGRIWGVEWDGNGWNNRLLLASGLVISSFGEDETGEIYAAHATAGTVHRLEGTRAPRFRASAVVNAASFKSGLAPGSLATIFASGLRNDEGIVTADRLPLPSALAGVAVTVGGIAAPVYSVSNVNGQEQVTFQAPSGLAGRSSAAVVVTRDGQSNDAVDVPVSPAAPGIFMAGAGQAAVLHASDFTLATAVRPLLRLGFAVLYATGLGEAANAPGDGQAAPFSPLARSLADVRVTIGGVPCEVLFAGLAPGFVGVYQVNFLVAEEAGSGLQELVLSANGTASPGVPVEVR